MKPIETEPMPNSPAWVEEPTSAGVRVQAVEARSSAREQLRGEGVDAKLGAVSPFTSVADGVEGAYGHTHVRAVHGILLRRPQRSLRNQSGSRIKLNL